MPIVVAFYYATYPAVTVVLASRGYPEGSSTGDVVRGVGNANGVNDVDVIHAGTGQRVLLRYLEI